MRAFLVALIAGAPARVGHAQDDDQDWERARSIGTAAALYDYILRNPSGAHLSDALSSLDNLGALDEAAPGRQVPSVGNTRSVPAGTAATATTGVNAERREDEENY